MVTGKVLSPSEFWGLQLMREEEISTDERYSVIPKIEFGYMVTFRKMEVTQICTVSSAM